MRKKINNGISYTVNSTVTKEKLASSVGSGTDDVFSTPMMIAMMENSAMLCIKDYLDDNETSVGTEINCKHLSASPLGIKINCTAKVTAVDGRKIDFEILANDEAGLIGTATHSRFILDKEKFITKANAKINE